MSHRVRIGAIVLSALLFSAVLSESALAAPVYQFTAIDVPGATRTEVRAINNLGHVAGTYVGGDGGVFGFTYDGSLFRTITYPGATKTEVEGINDLGQVVGHFVIDESSSAGRGGFVYDGAAYTQLTSPTDAGIKPADINNAGTIVGTLGAMGSKGFVLQGGVYAIFEVPNSYATVLTSINEAGVFGGYSRLTPFPDPAEPSLPPIVHGFLQAGSTFTEFGPNIGTGITSINDHGLFAGWTSPIDVSNGLPEHFLAQGEAFSLVALPGDGRGELRAVNAAEQIAGWYVDDRGVHGFVGRVPEPATAALLAVGALTLLLCAHVGMCPCS